MPAGCFCLAAAWISASRGPGAGPACRVHVPLPIVIVSALAVSAGAWWYGTRSMDFLTPPDEDTLAAIRQRVEASLPQPDRPPDAISVPDESPAGTRPDEAQEEAVKPVIDLGDLRSVPGLRAYREVAPKGVEYLAELASILETEGEFQRALLVWERVLDQGGAPPEKAERAASALRRLRPTLPDWNVDPEGAIPVVIHVETAASQAKALEEALEEVAQTIERASSGILAVTTEVVANPQSAAAEGPAPVAMRLAGGGKGSSASTEVLSFRIGAPEQLAEQAGVRVFQLLCNYLERAPGIEPPAPLAEGESAAEAMEFRVTRLSWQDFGAALNDTAVPDE